ALSDATSVLRPEEFVARGRPAFDRPGLCSWWVDEDGAKILSRGLGLAVNPGLIYAGLAGATRWPSGIRSNNTLWLRIMTMHLGGNHEFSTFRRTLGAILAHADGVTRIDENALTLWMYSHLRLIAVPYDDRDRLGRLERNVLTHLDPPLNLQGMATTPVRARLRELRRAITN
ncbi:GIY-YIG nuclease family protein, partial [Mycobacterium kubicae]|uniref:GIY-YIG nuclease family protein n=1 Tax=Mycobacterium kubicae TaxID=120959 RepID=UPI000AEA5BA7